MTEFKYEDHVIRLDDDWGLGQIDLETILNMLLIGEDIGLTFTLAKKVTAMNDITGEEQTVSAPKGYLFVYSSENRELTDFWAEVDKKVGGQNGKIQRRGNEKSRAQGKRW